MDDKTVCQTYLMWVSCDAASFARVPLRQSLFTAFEAAQSHLVIPAHPTGRDPTGIGNPSVIVQCSGPRRQALRGRAPALFTSPTLLTHAGRCSPCGDGIRGRLVKRHEAGDQGGVCAVRGSCSYSTIVAAGHVQCLAAQCVVLTSGQCTLSVVVGWFLPI